MAVGSMGVKSRSDLVHRALRNLGVLASGQVAGAEEYSAVNDLVEPMIEDLIARDIIHIMSTSEFQDQHFTHLGHVLAGQAQAEFGLLDDAAISARAIKAEMDLNKIDRIPTRHLHMRTMRTDYPSATIGTST